MEKINQNAMMNLLESSYEASINGLPGSETVEELAKQYLSKHPEKNEAIKKFVEMQILKCSTSGFLSGLGGIITMPVTIPANIASVIYVQMRMIATIAYMNGYDIRDDAVKTLIYVCLCGNGAKDIMKNFGINFGKKFSVSLIKKIPGTVLTKINQKVGFRLITKFGNKGLINLGKTVLLAGGVIGGTVDYGSTKVIANVAEKMFLYETPEYEIAVD